VISAIILAAGQSKRMGQPKMLLPWGKSTVIEHVIHTFLNAGLEDVILITGGAREQIEVVIRRYPVRMIHNQDFETGEMSSSIRCGLQALPERAQAALIGLGDQPQIQENSVRSICEEYRKSQSSLIVPSFQMRRGHPWLIARPLWKEILELKQPESPRDFLIRHAGEIHYVLVDTPSVLADLDTPEDYRKSRPADSA
jgi:molybdenum cofactor cytidylyltransferase